MHSTTSITEGPRLVQFLGLKETALIGDWFSTKTKIFDFWIFKVHLSKILGGHFEPPYLP